MASIYKCCHNKTIRPGKGWTDKDGIRHPSNWHIWSPAEKEARGIIEIVLENPPDSRLYTWSQNADGTINSSPKPLADAGEGDSVVLGVKSHLKAEVDKNQGSLLAQTDWYVVRRADVGKAIPMKIQAWRNAIRTAGDAMCAAIDEAADTGAIAALFITHDENYVKSGVLYDWPEEEIP